MQVRRGFEAKPGHLTWAFHAGNPLSWPTGDWCPRMLRLQDGGQAGAQVGSPPLTSLPPQTLLPVTDSHSRFNPSMSSTYSSNGQIFSVQYGSGSLSGIYGYDTLRVSQAAGHSVPQDVELFPGALTWPGNPQT